MNLYKRGEYTPDSYTTINGDSRCITAQNTDFLGKIVTINSGQYQHVASSIVEVFNLGQLGYKFKLLNGLIVSPDEVWEVV